MKILHMEQRSPEWWEARKGTIGGTSFGQVISGRKNRLKYDLLNEMLNEFPDTGEDFMNDDQQFGIDNEPYARKLYTELTGVKMEEAGMILSDFSSIHHASPDGLNEEFGIALEIKCTQDGGIHIQRYFEGPETTHLPQIINYFAVSDSILRVDWVSFCPYRPERPLIIKQFFREQFTDEIEKGRRLIKELEQAVEQMKGEFIF